MGQLKWYKRDPSDALNGMMELSLEERGAFNTVLDLIYSRDGSLPDDDRFIAGWMRVDVRVWKRLKSVLIEREKLFVADGFIRNERADVEVLAALSRVASAQDAGLASARSKAIKCDAINSENNDLASTTVGTTFPTTVSTNYNYNHNIEPNGSIPPVSPTPKKRAGAINAKRLPNDWHPVLTLAAQRVVDGWPPGKFDQEITKFRDHVADKGRTSLDWQAAFRTWITNANEWMKPNGNGTRQNHTAADEPRNAFVRAAAERQAQRAAGFGEQPSGWPANGG